MTTEQQLAELAVDYKNLRAAHERVVGTPCEQHLHYQEVEALQAELRAEKAISLGLAEQVRELEHALHERGGWV